MNLSEIIGELRRELEAVNEVMAALDRLARFRKRRGRPPLLELEALEDELAPRRQFTEETKKKMAAAQKKRWAAYRKSKPSGNASQS